MSRRIGRNDRCPCGSGKKFKYCCAAKGERLSIGATLWYWIVGLMLVVGAIVALTSLDELDEGSGPGPGRVWSPEHQHWH